MAKLHKFSVDEARRIRVEIIRRLRMRAMLPTDSKLYGDVSRVLGYDKSALDADVAAFKIIDNGIDAKPQIESLKIQAMAAELIYQRSKADLLAAQLAVAEVRQHLPSYRRLVSGDPLAILGGQR